MATFTKTDIEHVAIGGALLGSGGGGSFSAAESILKEVPNSYAVEVDTDPDFNDTAAVLAFIGSPDAGERLTLAQVEATLANTITRLTAAASHGDFTRFAPAETGALNMVVPLLVPLVSSVAGLAIYDGDGAGRAVPKLEQLTYASAIEVSPVVLANQQLSPDTITTDLNVPDVTAAETLARSIVSGAFGSSAGIGLWSEGNPATRWANALIQGTISSTRDLGAYMAEANRSTSDIVNYISGTMQRAASVLVKGQLTNIAERTSGGFDIGRVEIREDATGNIFTIYNQNENLLLFSDQSSSPIALVPDSICYYSEVTHRGFSNASDDIMPRMRETISVIGVEALAQFSGDQAIFDSFRQTLRSIGYAGKFPV